MRAIWNGVVIAESGDTVVVEGNHYFPALSLNKSYIKASDHHTFCGWKGEASYYSLNVNGKINENAVWYYATPKKGAEEVAERVAFWKGVEVVA